MTDMTSDTEHTCEVSSHRETDKDLVVIADLLAEVKQLEGEVFAWRMRNHKLADEVKAALATLAEVREVVHRVGDFAIKDVDGIVAIAAILDRGPR